MLASLEKVDEMEKECQHKEKKITFKSLFLNRHSFFAMLLCFVGATYSSFFEAFLAISLSDRGLDPNKVGYIFGIDCFVFGICSVIYSYSCIKFPRKIIFIMGLFDGSISDLRLTKWLSFNNHSIFPFRIVINFHFPSNNSRNDIKTIGRVWNKWVWWSWVYGAQW